MRFTWNWLLEFVELDATPSAVADRLTMAGLEVDAIEHAGNALDHVVCAEVLAVRPHPGADRLQICDVRSGSDEVVSVVCGAPNVAVGQRVPLARPGAVLPNGQKVAATEIRGVASAGMLCSAAEIGAGDDTSGLLLLDADTVVGASVAAVLGLTDTVLELSITPNRGDCLSVLGIAREVAALTGARLRQPQIVVPEVDDDIREWVDIAIEDDALCRRYVGRMLRGIRIAPSPLWMQTRLKAVGLRPINNVVDITNYVMLERGQPLHAFDYDRLPAKEITVRRAGRTATFTTLDSVERALMSDDLLITSGGEPVALAGIMGGENSEVIAATESILLEAAWFAPAAIRRTAKRLGLRSEASYRFERGVDIEEVAAAADRAAALMTQLAGGRVYRGRCDVYPVPHRGVPITLRPDRLEAMLGVALPAADAVTRLRAFSMPAEIHSDGTVRVTPPAYRSDITREIDVIEEVARSLGYENVPTTLPTCVLDGSGLTPAAEKQREIRRLLAALGFDEVVALSFAAPEWNRQLAGLVADRTPVRILNPLTQEDSEMRLSLLSCLLQATQTNLAHGAGDFAGFALGKVFWDDKGTYRERRHLAAVVSDEVVESGVGARAGAWDFADLKGVVEAVLERFALPPLEWRALRVARAYHPGKAAEILFDGVRLGVVACLHPECAETWSLPDPVWVFELDLEKLLDYLPPPVVLEELPRFPVVGRDLALVAEVGFESGRVVRAVREWEGSKGLIESVRLTDRYVGAPLPDGKESLTFSLSFRSREKTLTDAEVNEVHGRLVAVLRAALPVELR